MKLMLLLLLTIGLLLEGLVSVALSGVRVDGFLVVVIVFFLQTMVLVLITYSR